MVGCAESHRDIEPLTSKERDELAEIALGTDEASELLARYGIYTIEMRWLVIEGFSLAGRDFSLEIVKEEEVIDGKLPPNVKEPIIIYPAVLIRFGEPEKEQLRVAIDRELGRVVMLERLIVGRECVPPADNPVVVAEVVTTLSGRYYYLAIGDKCGEVVYIEDEGLRHPSEGHEAIRTTRTGHISEDELASLVELFEEPPLDEVAEYHAYTKMIDTDARCEISFSYAGVNKTIRANYNPLDMCPTDLPELPPSMKEIFLALKHIVDHEARQESRVRIACESTDVDCFP